MTPPSGRPPCTPARPTFKAVYEVGLPFLRQALRWLGVAAHDVDDVLQDVLLAAYRGLDRYRPARGTPCADAPQQTGDAGAPQGAEAPDRQIKQWLFGIAWRQVGHHRERAFRRREIAMGAGTTWSIHPIDPGLNSEQIITSEQQGQLVGCLLEKLDPERRLVLILHDLLDVPLSEIARENGENENTLRNRLRLAREDFRVAVKRMNVEERLALGGVGSLSFADRTRFLDPDELLRGARAIPYVPERLRIALWASLQATLAPTRRSEDSVSMAQCSSILA